MKIGKNLKALRKDRKMTLKELSAKSSVAIATLSRMEHDIMTGTLDSHMQICNALGIKLAEFYREVEDSGKNVSFARKKDEKDTLGPAKKSSVELLTTKVLTKKMMPILLRINKGGSSHREENKPGSEKFIYVFEGSITARVGKEEHTLVKGDSLYFDASLPHVFINTGRGEALGLCVLTPPEF